jgi:autotransporter-associated beta strand protein
LAWLSVGVTGTATAGALYFTSTNSVWDNGTTADWATSTAGPYTSLWSGGSDAHFQGTAGVVTVFGPIASVNSLNFDVSGYALNSGSINLTGSGGPINVISGGTATINSALTGSTGVTVTGLGSLTLSSTTSSYSGPTSITMGTLVAGNNAFAGFQSAFGNATSAVTIGDANSNNMPAALVTGGPLSLGYGVEIDRNVTVNATAGPTTLGDVTAGDASLPNNNGLVPGAAFTGPITLNRSVTLSAAPGGSVSFTGNISGSGGITAASQGNGNVSLTNTNTFTGTTTVASGQLTLDYSSLASSNGTSVGGILPPTPVVLSGGTWALTNHGQNYAVNDTFASTQVSNVGSTVVINDPNFLGVYANLGAITRTGGVLDLPVAVQGNFNGQNAAFTTTSGNVNGIMGGYLTVNGWTDWAANDGAGNVVPFSSVSSYNTDKYSQPTNNVDVTVLSKAPSSSVTINSLRFNTTPAGTLALGGTVTVTSGGILVTPTLGTAAVTISGGALTASVTTSTDNLADVCVIQGNTSASFTIASPIVNNGSTPIVLTKGGPGELILTGTNTYTGGTTVTAGTLQLGTGLPGHDSLLAGNIANNGTLVIDLNGNQSYGGTISGGGSLTKVGSGILTLAGTNSFSGGTTISAGVLQAGNSAALAATTGALVINAGGTLDVHGCNLNITALSGSGIVDNLSGSGSLIVGNANSSGTFSGIIQDTIGQLSLMKTGTGTLTLAGNNSYTGGTTISAGTLQVSSDANLGGSSGAISLSNAMLTYSPSATTSSIRTLYVGSSGTLNNLQPNNGVWFENTVSGGSLTILGGNFIFRPSSGSNSLAAFSLASGITYLSTQNSLGTAAVSVASRATFDVDLAGYSPTNTMTFASGAGFSVRSGTLTLNTAYDTFPSSGTLNFNLTEMGGGGSGVINGNYPVLSGPMDFNVGAASLTLSGAISGAGASGLTASGPGTLVLAGSNTYSGGTTVSAGTLQIGNGGKGEFLASPTVNVGSGASLIFNHADALTYSGAISGSGSLTKLGGGALTMTGASSMGGNVIVDGGSMAVPSGSLSTMGNVFVGNNANGGFVQTGGIVAISSTAGSNGYLYVGNNVGSVGSYNLSGGSLWAGQYEYIGFSGSGSFTQSRGTNSVSNGNMVVGFFGGSSGAYNLSGSGLLSTPQEYIGLEGGTGTFTQTGGTNALSSALWLGTWAGSSGTYTLSGSGLVSSPQESFGYLGTAAFTQSGGTNSSPVLVLGNNPGGAATYNLTGGSLSSASFQQIGYGGSGTFAQSGGTNMVSGGGYLALGCTSSGSGTYYLSGSGLLSAPTEEIGIAGGGVFTQTAGTNTISGSLVLAQSAGSTGTYDLNGGLLSLAGSGLLAGAGSAAFNFSGGTLQARASFSTSVPIVLATAGSNGIFNTNDYALTLAGPLSGPGGFQKGGTGTLTLSASNGYTGTTLVTGGTLLLANTAALSGSTFDTSGSGALSFGALSSATFGGLQGTGNLTLNNAASGAVALSVGGNNTSTTFSGTLSGSGSLVKLGSGVFTLTGMNSYGGATTVGAGTLQLLAGRLPAANEYVGSGGTASLVQSGGTNSVSSSGTLYLGYNVTDSGTYNLSGSGLLSAPYQIIGYSGLGSFTQTGGTNSVSSNLTFGSGYSSNGTYSLGGNAQLSASNEYIGYAGTGSAIQSGGTNWVSSNLFLGSGMSGSGTYSLNGGSLSAPTENIGSYGTGSFTQSAGTNSVSNYLSLGTYDTGWGTYSLSGSGLLSAPTEYVGKSTEISGSFTQTGGTNSVSGGLVLAQGASSGGTYNLNGGLLTLSGLTQGSGSAAFSFSGGVFQAGSSFLTSVPIVLTTTGSNGVFDTQGNALTLAGPLSGPGGFQKVGSGTLILSASNGFTGTTLVSGGTLALANRSALSGSTFDTSGVGLLSFGTLTSAVFGGLQGSGNLTLNDTAAAAVALTVGGNNASTTFSGDLSGSGGLTKVGTGTLTFAGSDSYTGSTTVSGGTLGLSSNVLPASAAVNIVSGADLNLGFNGIDVVGSVYLNGVLQDSGSFSAGNAPAFFSGSGALKVLALPRTWNVSTPYFGDWNTASNWVGGFVPNGIGKIATFDNSVASPTAAITNLPVTLGVLNIASASRVDITGVDQGTLTMQADATDPRFAGAAQINISGGALDKINLPLSFNSSTAISVAAGSTLEIGNPVNLNGQTVTMTGGGTLQLDVNFSAAGGTLQANAGAVAIGAQAIVSPALLDISGNAQLTGAGTIQGGLMYDSSSASTFAGNIAGAGSSLVLDAGSGRLTLTGDDTYDGGTDVLSGTLVVAFNSALPEGSSLTVGAAGTLIFDSSVAASPVMNPAAVVSVPEPGTLVLLLAGAALVAMYCARCQSSNRDRTGSGCCISREAITISNTSR